MGRETWARICIRPALLPAVASAFQHQLLCAQCPADRWVGAASQGSSAQQQGSSAGGTDAATKREQAAELFKQSSVAFNALREYLGKQQQQQRAMGGARQS
jgi:hypothetical protein